MQATPLCHALISVFDKTGLEPLCRRLHELGVKLYSTGGTADSIEKMGLAVTRIEAVTDYPEMMDGRVKTLHPKVFGGILARRDNEKDREEAAKFGIPLFDLIVVNLYPFWDHLNKTPKEQSAFVDIGGPSMLRAAGKNHESVTVLSHPSDYAEFIAESEAHQGTSLAFRKRMAGRTFARTSYYDSLIAEEWADSDFPAGLSLVPQKGLRYGENPHQKAAWIGEPRWKVLQGKELSYNNLLDSEAAVRIVQEFEIPAVAIIKHGNPCGAAAQTGPIASVFQKALDADPKSAYGGIVALNEPVDQATAEKMAPIFFEVIIAPAFDDAAQAILKEKKNLRLIAWEKPYSANFELRASMGGWLIQQNDDRGIPEELKTVTKEAVATNQTRDDLAFAWLIAKHVRSNAIVIAKDGQTLGIGAGQMSRVDAMEIALQKAKGKTTGAVIASDAFFPFRDNIDLLKGLGFAAIIQPGGSQRDSEVIAACDEHEIAMVFTGERHFRH